MDKTLIQLEVEMDKLFELYLTNSNEIIVKKLYSRILYLSMEIQLEKEKQELNYD